ncbi:hypothetical protein [Streptomyces sp. R35]|uniref:Uncharacterized protein n=1 Tax=Streptomyces sp. R35 TaxID=3238630 RepID=A0AB39SDM3_9ACTN
MNETEDQYQLNAQAKKRPMGDIRAPQREQENEGRHTNAASPQLASPLLVLPQHQHIFDRHSGAERTQLTRPGHQKIDRPEQRHDDNAADLNAPGGAGQPQIIHGGEDQYVRGNPHQDPCQALSKLGSNNPHKRRRTSHGSFTLPRRGPSYIEHRPPTPVQGSPDLLGCT